MCIHLYLQTITFVIAFPPQDLPSNNKPATAATAAAAAAAATAAVGVDLLDMGEEAGWCFPLFFGIGRDPLTEGDVYISVHWWNGTRKWEDYKFGISFL